MRTTPSDSDTTKQEEVVAQHAASSSLSGMTGKLFKLAAILAAVFLPGGTGCVAPGRDATSGANPAAPVVISLVYSVENTGTKYPAPPLPALGDLPFIEPLPDPFAWAEDPMGRTRSTKFSDWSHHRAEMKAQIEHFEIGTKPAVDRKNLTASFANRTLTVHVTVGTNTITLNSRVQLPPGTGPFPAMIGMNGLPNLRAAPMSQVAKIQFNANQVSQYGRAPSANDSYYQLYPELLGQSGQYSAWSWGVSRIIDGLELVQKDLPIDLAHIGVVGCSYAGKMALFAGALDERIALTIAQESGGGGDTSWRYSTAVNAKVTDRNQRVEALAQTDRKWFRTQMFQFGNTNVSYLPEDHHMLMAMIAPRALLCTGNTGYVWLSNPSAYICNRATERVYDQLGISDRFGFIIDGDHGHCQTTPDIDEKMGAFINKFLLGQLNLDTHVRVFPAEYGNVDYARWTAWWGTTKPVLPPGEL